ncbi:MAG: hypothetical protein NW701_15220 [Nitrospira sp.]
MRTLTSKDHHRSYDGTRISIRPHVLGVLVIGCFAMAGTVLSLTAEANHEGREHAVEDHHEAIGAGHPIPGVSFQVFLDRAQVTTPGDGFDQAQADAAVQTVVDAFTFMIQHRTDYQRFDETIKKNLLEKVIIESTVVNQDGKSFPFLVARTKEPGRVKLLINGSSLKEKGHLGHPDRLVPVLAREFQWVVSKADTSPKPKTVSVERDLKHAPIRSDKEIREMSGDDRTSLIQQLFDTYLKTVDDHKSLEGQSYYEVGTTALIPPAQPDSTIKLYEIRVREALQKIVRDAYFSERTPKAVKSLLNGTVWNVAFVKIDQRDWATRTRVLSEDKAVAVGGAGRVVQPAAILVNTYRTAAPDDPFYQDTKGLPMGALSADQLARVIALEIQHNIIEKSMTGHVAQDEMTAPK